MEKSMKYNSSQSIPAPSSVTFPNNDLIQHEISKRELPKEVE